MLERVHEHILTELQQVTRTDTVTVLTAVAFNLLVLGINSAMAGGVHDADGIRMMFLISFVIFLAATLIVNGLAILALGIGKQSRTTLLQGMVAMYVDNEVDKYYDVMLLTNYSRRYVLFNGVIIVLAVVAILVPLTISLM